MTRTLPGSEPIERLRAVCDVQQWDAERPPADGELARGVVGCDGLLTMLTERVDATLIEGCPGLRVVANMAVGYDNIDVPAMTEAGVLVTNTPGVLTETTADMAFALLLASARRIGEGETAIRDGSWGPWHPTWMLGREVHGSTLGIVGPGRIGTAVARRASGFGMHVIYSGRGEAPDFPGDAVTFEELLERSHFVSAHVPQTPQTERMFDAPAFRRMRRDAIFINTARGGVVDQPALAAALRSGEIAGAALDVMTPEPLPPDDALLASPHLVLAPHLGSATLRTRERMASLAVDGLLAGLAGERPRHLVDASAWERRR